MKFLKRALVASVAALALAVGPAVSAEAASTRFDVTKLSASSVVVTSSGCRNVTVNMSHKKTNAPNWDVFVDVTRNGSMIDSLWYGDFGDTSRTRAFICPSLYGLGKYGLDKGHPTFLPTAEHPGL
jgi:hypothetical protein